MLLSSLITFYYIIEIFIMRKQFVWMNGRELCYKLLQRNREGLLFSYNKLMAQGKQNTVVRVGEMENPHAFLLKRVEPISTSSVQVDFAPITSTQLSTDPSNSPTLFPPTFPVFNHDGHHFTPSFTLHLEKEKTVRHLDTYLKIHQQRALDMSLERDELFVPKPSRSNSFCCICRTLFDDYLTHVNIPTHQQLLRDIVELTQRFNVSISKPNQSKKTGKTQHIKKRSKRERDSPKLSSCQSSTNIFIENDNVFEKQTVI